MADNVEFQTEKAEEIKFGRNSFVEIARKKAVSDDGENVFISISKGFFAPDGSKRFSGGRCRNCNASVSRNISLPNEPDVVKDIAKKLAEVLK